jgi:plastocyanin
MRRFQVLAMYSVVVMSTLGLSIGIVFLIRPDTTTASATTTRSEMAIESARESQVEIENFEFKPKELMITVGTKVTWVNKDDVPHTATSTNSPVVFDSKVLDTDQRYSFTFSSPGTYKYYCKAHPHMIGTVIVKEHG